MVQKNRERKLKDKSQSGRKYLLMYVTDKVSNEIPYTVTSKTQCLKINKNEKKKNLSV